MVVPGVGRQLLLVEDLETNRRVASYHLEKLGYKIEWVEDGQAALERCSQKSYDLIFMDLQMPRMDGFQAFQEIRGHGGPNQNTPIIALTAAESGNHKKRCQELGFNGTLQKPFQRTEIQAILEFWLK